MLESLAQIPSGNLSKLSSIMLNFLSLLVHLKGSIQFASSRLIQKAGRNDPMNQLSQLIYCSERSER